jgi:hypothetical protein
MLLDGLPFEVKLAGRWFLSVQMGARQKDRGPVGPRPVGAKPEPARGGYDAGPVAGSDPNKPGTGLLLTISKDCVKQIEGLEPSEARTPVRLSSISSSRTVLACWYGPFFTRHPGDLHDNSLTGGHDALSFAVTSGRSA